MEELISKLKENNLIDDINNIILEKYDNGLIQVVDQETFKGFFGSTNYSYMQLVSADEVKGYKPFFNKWKELGIL